MNHRDSGVQLEQERAHTQTIGQNRFLMGAKSKRESFRNHPDDPDNPNKVRERYLQVIRSLQPHRHL
jgi:hypothetical protein